MTPAGQRNRKVTIAQRVSGADTWGQPSTTWETVATVYADIRAPSGKAAAEGMAADRDARATTYSMRINYRPAVSAGMRVSLGSVHFDIADVVHDFAGKAHTDLVCIQGSSDGG